MQAVELNIGGAFDEFMRTLQPKWQLGEQGATSDLLSSHEKPAIAACQGANPGFLGLISIRSPRTNAAYQGPHARD